VTSSLVHAIPYLKRTLAAGGG